MSSLSNASLFQDIPIPSPWCCDEVGGYEPEPDIAWELRKDQIYWRGSNAEGHSHGGSCLHLKLQRVIASLERNPGHPTLQRREWSTCSIAGHEGWEVRKSNETEISEYFKAHFIDIVDCEEDLADESIFFDVVDRECHNQAWNYRY
jgi:hypothetical protein